MATRRRSTSRTSKKDEYSNVVVKLITMTAANTLTFDAMDFGLSLFDKVGILINRLEYHVSVTSISEMTAANDLVQMGLTTSDAAGAQDPDSESLIHKTILYRSDFGTAGSAQLWQQPLMADFSQLPGMGILVTPRPLYGFVGSSGLASAANVTFRMFFTVIPLSSENYFELLESRHYFGQ